MHVRQAALQHPLPLRTILTLSSAVATGRTVTSVPLSSMSATEPLARPSSAHAQLPRHASAAPLNIPNRCRALFPFSSSHNYLPRRVADSVKATPGQVARPAQQGIVQAHGAYRYWLPPSTTYSPTPVGPRPATPTCHVCQRNVCQRATCHLLLRRSASSAGAPLPKHATCADVPRATCHLLLRRCPSQSMPRSMPSPLTRDTCADVTRATCHLLLRRSASQSTPRSTPSPVRPLEGTICHGRSLMSSRPRACMGKVVLHAIEKDSRAQRMSTVLVGF